MGKYKLEFTWTLSECSRKDHEDVVFTWRCARCWRAHSVGKQPVGLLLILSIRLLLARAPAPHDLLQRKPSPRRKRRNFLNRLTRSWISPARRRSCRSKK